MIPHTDHKKIKYRNCETGILLTSVRKSESLSVMTVRDKDGSILYHNINGKYLGMKDEHSLDIVEITDGL